MYAAPIACSASLAPQPLGSALEEHERVAEAAADGCDVELLLRPEEAEEVRLGDACALRDVLGRRAFEAAVGELDEGRVEDRVLALGGGEAGVGRGSCALG